MGVYNRLHVVVPCRVCRQPGARTLQVKYGECQLFDYQLGSEVQWATGKKSVTNRGRPAAGTAWTPAYAEEPCPRCGDEAVFADFAVVVERDQLVRVVQAPRGFRFSETEDVVPLDEADEPLPEPEPR